MKLTAASILAAAAGTGNVCPRHPAYEADYCPGCVVVPTPSESETS